MDKINKYLMLFQFLLLNVIGQNIIQSAAIIQTEQRATNLDSELIENVRLRNREKVKQLIEADANVNAVDKYGETPLIKVAREGYKEIAELLINKSGVNISATDECGWTALMWASLKGHKEIVEILLRAGADIEHKFKDKNAIKIAQKRNKQEIVKMLENEPSRRVEVVKKWIKEKFAKEITESTSGLLIPDIANIIAQYSIEYTDIPLEYRLVN